MAAGARAYRAPCRNGRLGACTGCCDPDHEGMTCETCATPARTFRLLGTTEALCVECFVAAHPPARTARGCTADLRRRPKRSWPGRCR